MTREYTNKILNAVEDGSLTPEIVMIAALNWMSEDDVREMAFANDFFFDNDGENDDS